MKKPTHLCMKFVLVCLICLSAVPKAFGCAYHPALDVQLDRLYPGSFGVAAALHKAADNGVIDTATLEATSMGTAHYDDALRRLQEFGRDLSVSPAAASLPASFSLGYVDSQLWTRYSQFDGKIRVDIHTGGPVEGEAVVLTGEPVLTELLAGRLSVERAMTDGVILIDGNDAEKMAICNALREMSFVNKLTQQ